MNIKNKILYGNGKYYAVYLPNHSKALKDGYVYEHWLIAEKILGRPIINEYVHHIDNNGLNNQIQNLMIFKTNSDHIKYHHCIKYGWPFNLYCKDNVFEIELQDFNNHRVINNSYFTFCEKCGQEIGFNSTLCKKCTQESMRKVIRPSKEELSALLKSYNYSQIAKIYNVSSNAIKKWAKKYEIYENCFHKIPNKNDFIEYMKCHNKQEATKYYNVSFATIDVWIKTFKLTYVKECIKCIETGKYYKSAKDAIKDIDMSLNAKSRGERIRKAAHNQCSYLGYHWEIIPAHIEV